MRRPALIFDFGNVVAFFDFRKACDHFGQRLGITGEAFLDRVRGLGFSALVQEYERGKLTAEGFSKAVGALAGLDLTHEEFATAWSDIFWLNEPVARLVAHLKGIGYTLVLGSNTNDLHAAHFRRQFAETLAHFDRLVLSYEVGHIKPTSAFYLACAEAAQAPPCDCVFIDDLPENVEGAKAAGLSGLLFRDTPALWTTSAPSGLKCPPTWDNSRPSRRPQGHLLLSPVDLEGQPVPRDRSQAQKREPRGVGCSLWDDGNPLVHLHEIRLVPRRGYRGDSGESRHPSRTGASTPR